MSDPRSAGRITPWRRECETSDAVPVWRVPRGQRMLDIVMLLVILSPGLFLGCLAPLAGLLLTAVMLVLALVVATCVPWEVRLLPDAVAVRGLGRSVREPYAGIRFAMARNFAPDDDRDGKTEIAGRVPKGRRVQPLVFWHGFRRYRVMLAAGDADACLRALLARCPRAAGIDSAGNEILPTDPAALRAGHRRLALAWGIPGVSAVVLGAVGLIVPGTVDTVQDVLKREQLRVIAPAVLAWGVFALDRARRHFSPGR